MSYLVKSFTYESGSKYILIKNNETSVTVELEYYKLAFTPTLSIVSDQPNDGGLTWVSGTGDFADYEYALNTSQLSQTDHETQANTLNANLATIVNYAEMISFII